MEPTTLQPKTQEAIEKSGSLKASLMERVKEYLKEIDDLVETREELLKYVRALEVMEKELNNQLENRRAAKKKTVK
jgi:hypothetical protein